MVHGWALAARSWRGPVAGGGAEVVEVAGGAGGVVLVVAGRGLGTRLVAAPGRVVAVGVVGVRAVLVGVVAGGEDRPGHAVEQVGGRLVAGRGAGGDVSRADQDRVGGRRTG